MTEHQDGFPEYRDPLKSQSVGLAELFNAIQNDLEVVIDQGPVYGSQGVLQGGGVGETAIFIPGIRCEFIIAR